MEYRDGRNKGFASKFLDRPECLPSENWLSFSADSIALRHNPLLIC